MRSYRLVARKVRATLGILLFCSSLALAGEWEPTDKWLFGGFITLQLIDAAQTYEVAKHPQEFREANSLYGNPPTAGRIIFIKTLSTALIYTLLDDYTAPTDRRAALWFLDALYLGVTAHNYSVGVRISFH